MKVIDAVGMLYDRSVDFERKMPFDPIAINSDDGEFRHFRAIISPVNTMTREEFSNRFVSSAAIISLYLRNNEQTITGGIDKYVLPEMREDAKKLLNNMKKILNVILE